MDRSSLRAVAERVGLSHGALHNFLAGSTPYASTLDRIERWLGEVSAGARRMMEPAARPSPEPDLPDVSFLAPRARAYYEQRLGSYFTRRWPAELIERAARSLVDQIRGANTLRQVGPGEPGLTDDEQLVILEGASEWVEREYGRLVDSGRG